MTVCPASGAKSPPASAARVSSSEAYRSRTLIAASDQPSEAARRYRDKIASTVAELGQPATAGGVLPGAGFRLTGRFIHVSDDLSELVARSEEIVGADLRVLRLPTALDAD